MPKYSIKPNTIPRYDPHAGEGKPAVKAESSAGGEAKAKMKPETKPPVKTGTKGDDSDGDHSMVNCW